MPPVKRFSIDRSKWLQGDLYKRYKAEHKDDEFGKREICGTLLDEEGRMCCLGFYSVACQVPKVQVKRYQMPASNWHQLDERIRKVGGAAGPLADANDQVAGLSPKKREAKITRLFARVGVRVTFRGKYPVTKNIKPQKPKKL